MYRQILLGYNGSLEGRRPLRESGGLAPSMQAGTRLPALSRTPAGADPALMRPIGTLRPGLEDVVQEDIAWLRARGLEAVGHLAFGDPVTEMPACARRLPAGWIVGGHRHCSARARWWSASADGSLRDEAPSKHLGRAAGVRP